MYLHTYIRIADPCNYTYVCILCDMMAVHTVFLDLYTFVLHYNMRKIVTLVFFQNVIFFSLSKFSNRLSVLHVRLLISCRVVSKGICRFRDCRLHGSTIVGILPN